MPPKNQTLSFKITLWIPLGKPGLLDSLPSSERSDLPSQPAFQGERPPAMLVQIPNSLNTNSPPASQDQTRLLVSQKPDPNASKTLSNHDTLSPRLFSSANRCFPMKCNSSEMKMSVDAWIRTKKSDQLCRCL